MKLEEKNKARQLRYKGLSMRQIAEMIGVSKGSVSAWVRDVELSREALTKISQRRRLGREQSRVTRLSNIAKINSSLESRCRDEVLPLSDRDLWIAGLMLYAGEGYKSSSVSGQRVEIANSNPELLRIFIDFLIRICLISKEKIRVRLMLYEDINTEEAKRYWAGELGVSLSQFCTPFIKRSYRNLPYRHLRRSEYGTAHVNLYDTKTYKKIIGWIKAVCEYRSPYTHKA